MTICCVQALGSSLQCIVLNIIYFLKNKSTAPLVPGRGNSALLYQVFTLVVWSLLGFAGFGFDFHNTFTSDRYTSIAWIALSMFSFSELIRSMLLTRVTKVHSPRLTEHKGIYCVVLFVASHWLPLQYAQIAQYLRYGSAVLSFVFWFLETQFHMKRIAKALGISIFSIKKKNL